MGRLVRWITATLACVLGVAAVTAAITACYAKAELLDTDGFVARADAIAEDQDVQDEIAGLLTAKIEAALDISSLTAQADSWLGTNGAPAEVQALLDSAASSLHDYIQDEVESFIGSDAYRKVWDAAVSDAHSSLIAALEGDTGGTLAVEGQTLVLNLGPAVANVKDRLVADGFDLAADIPAVTAQVVLADSDQLPELQRQVDRANWAATWLPWIGLGLLILAFALAPRRWVTALIAGILGAVLAGAALWGLAEGRTLFLDRAQDAAYAPVTYAAFTDDLRDAYVAMLVVALVLAVLAVLMLFLRRKRTAELLGLISRLSRSTSGGRAPQRRRRPP